MPPNTAAPTPSTTQTITDPVTNQSFSRDTSVPGSTFQAPPASAAAAPANSPDDTSSIQDKVAQSLGYSSYNDAVNALTAAPTESETQLYNDAYKAAGLDTLSNTITGKQNDLATAFSNIDDNPWLDEADRVGRQRNLTTLANADIKNLQDEYNTKLTSVENLVKQQTSDQTATAASNKAKLAALEAQAKEAASAAATSAKASSAAPKTVKAADGTTYQWDPNSQSFVQLFAGKSGSGSGSGSTNDFAFTSKQLTALASQGLGESDANNILQDIKNGQSLEDIRQQMKNSTPPLDPGLLDSIMYYVDPAHNTPKKASTASSSTSSGSRTL